MEPIRPTSQPAQTTRAGDGASSTVAGSGNVTQTVNVASSKASKFISVGVPLIAVVLGAYATHAFTLMRAPENTAAQTETLLGIARGAIDLARSTKASPELIAKLEELETQSRAAQANVELLGTPKGPVSFHADFWLPPTKGAILGGSASFGVTQTIGPGDIWVKLNNNAHRLTAGTRLPYKAKDGKDCTITYLGQAPDGKLHGFKTLCG